MHYLVSIYLGKECLMPKGEMTWTGLNELMKYMSSLNRDGRNAFMYDLQNTGAATHIPEPDKKMQYGFAAVVKQ